MEYKLELSSRQLSTLEILVWRTWFELNFRGDDTAEEYREILNSVRRAKSVRKAEK